MKTNPQGSWLKDLINVLCAWTLILAAISGVGWLLWNIFGPAANQFSWLDAGILLSILAIGGYAATKNK